MPPPAKFAKVPELEVPEIRVTGIRPDRPGSEAPTIGALGDSPNRGPGPGTLGIRPDRPRKVPVAQVRVEDVALEEEMDFDASLHVFQRSLGCARMQYQQALQRDPTLHGKLTICLQLNAAGGVVSVDVEKDNLLDPILAAGIRSCLKRLRFSLPGEPEDPEVCVTFKLSSTES